MGWYCFFVLILPHQLHSIQYNSCLNRCATSCPRLFDIPFLSFPFLPTTTLLLARSKRSEGQVDKWYILVLLFQSGLEIFQGCDNPIPVAGKQNFRAIQSRYPCHSEPCFCFQLIEHRFFSHNTLASLVTSSFPWSLRVFPSDRLSRWLLNTLECWNHGTIW